MFEFENTEKRDDLLKIQKDVQDEWKITETYVTNKEVDYSKEKYMATFCMPYANGTMHLGHGYTVVKPDIAVRFKRLVGFNSIFPFAFHGTGMPIVGSATKLREEIEQYGNPPSFPVIKAVEDVDEPEIKSKGKIQSKSSAYKYQWQILEEMGVPTELIPNFQEPSFWLEYFPNIVKADLEYFGCGIDFTRSFITTDMNPYFDSFVRWQFNHLKEMEKIKYGTRMSIFSPKDNQMCADHDRSTGEGVKPKKFTLVRVLLEEYFVSAFVVVPNGQFGEIISCNVNENAIYHIYQTNLGIIIMTERAFNNMLAQKIFTKIEQEQCRTIIGKEIIGAHINYHGKGVVITHTDADFATGFSFKFEKEGRNNVEHIEYFEPEKEVISRTGSICVVAPTNQWFLTYGEDTWKQQVKDHIGTMETFNKTVKKKMMQGVDWLTEWGCSRSTGLGSRLPWDDSVLIESLSDSTIYMAYYTVCHLIHKDIYGKDGSISPDIFTDEVWDYIFFNDNKMPESISKELLVKMKKEFDYYYPLDLRVTGKDLINNHMTMCLYNHVAFWPDKAPRAFHINGHLRLNQQKMSKRNGNFMTIRQAVDKFSADVVRYCLAESVVSLDDADFSEVEANKVVLKLHNEKEWIIAQIKQFDQFDQFTQIKERDQDEEFIGNEFFDDLFMSRMKQLSKECKEAYEKMDYRIAIKIINTDLVKEKEFYCLAKETVNPRCIQMYISIYLTMLSPICPHFTEYLWKMMNNGESIVFTNWITFDDCMDTDDTNDLYNYLMMIVKQSRTIMAKTNYENKIVTVTVGKKMPKWFTFVYDYVKERINNDSKDCTFPDFKEFCKSLNDKSHGFSKANKKELTSQFKILQKGYAQTNSIDSNNSIDEFGFLDRYKQNIARILKIDELIVNNDPNVYVMKPIISN